MFKCIKCGLCCRNIDKVPELSDFHTGDGICIYLTRDNTCSIYSRRPNICNVDTMYEDVYKLYMSRTEFDKINMEGCKELQGIK